MWNMIFLVTGLIFILFLLVIFFPKKVIDSREIKIFKVLIMANVLEYLIEIPMQFIVRNYGIELKLVDYLSKGYLITILIWFSLFSIYTFTICLNKPNSEEKNDSLVNYSNLIACMIGIILIAISPINKFYEANKMYVYGDAVLVLKLFLGVFMMVWFVLLLSNIKRIIDKKYLPIFLIILLGLFNVIIQTVDPSILITSMMGTFICYTMYFTIENPDVKLVEYEKTEKERAEAASLAKSEFLSSMSHELRTPLNAIVGLSEDIDSFNDKVPSEVREDTKDIIKASETLLEIIGSILDISKIESGKLDIVPSDYDPREEFESVAKMNATKFKEKNLEFNVKIAENLPEVLFGDRIRIKQILNNFISNAYKYTDGGHVDFIVNWLDASGSLQIIVADTGRGVKPEDVEKIFEKYDRLGVEKSSNVQGTGLGLAITKTLIDLMGGTVKVESEYLVGTTFTVLLPQKLGSKEALEKIKKENERVVEKLDYTGKKLLVADDNMLNIKVLKKAIKDFNFTIDECYNGKEAIEKIEMDNSYDLVLLDIKMPIMGGDEAINYIRNMPNFHAPVVALTADAMAGAKEKYEAMGFDDYLAKPFTRDAIAKKLSSILGNGKDEVKKEEVKEEPVVEENKEKEE